MEKQISPQTKKLLLKYQKDEITGYHIYRRMAEREKDPKNKETLTTIADNEKEHAVVWQSYTKKEIKPSALRLLWYRLVTFFMGYTFVVKFMEKGEYASTKNYRALLNEIPEAADILEDEIRHENELEEMLDEGRLRYVGAIVLGLNDALVELTGTIAGLTFALANTRLIALSGIITGVSATLSMAASNYLAERANENPNALKASIYTGVAYLVTVVFLVLPYLLFPDALYWAALITMLTVVVVIIAFFNYYIAVAKSLPFLKRFREMAVISLGVAVISFLIGLAVKHFLGVDI